MKNKTHTFDAVVIGAGSAGFSAAEAIAIAGKKVAVVEKAELGGECPNWACVPTKAMLRSAHAYREAQKFADFGVRATRPAYRFQDIMRRKDAVVSTITGAGKRYGLIFEKLGVSVFNGAAMFEDKHTVVVNEQRLRAKFFVIASGAKDYLPPVDGLEESGFLTFRDVVSLKRKPSSVCVIGGGPVGCEFATFFASLDTPTTILQLDKQLLHREDADVAAIATMSMMEKGINVFTNTKTLSVRRSGRKKKVTFQVGRKKRQSILVDTIVVAAGKRANIESLNLEAAKVKTDSVGRLLVKETLQTSQPHIFAAGDVSGGMLFTHMGHAEGHVAGVNIVARLKSSRAKLQKRNTRVVPRVTFVDPEVASVGMTAQEATDQKIDISVGTFPMGALGRAVTEGERRGLVKLVVNKKTRRILGGHIVGPRAGELIHEVALAMHVNATVEDLSSMIHAYPTFSEAITAAAGNAL